MNDLYETKIPTAQWWAYDLPGNAGWIIWLICTWKCLAQGISAFSVLSLFPTILMIIGIIEIISEGDAIGMGFRVSLLEIGETEPEEYEIVGSQESDPRLGRISEESPIGRALMGKHTGDEIAVETPGGELHFRIVSALHS